jgi:ADP-L-glycero-D-manno-heptose 6-epimerase
MIVITGAAGFIGSFTAGFLNDNRYYDLVLVDDFSREDKKRNYSGLSFRELVDRENLFDWIDKNHRNIEFIIHLGARTDTTEFDKKVFDKLNLNYSKQVWNKAVEYGLPLIYASSAATYGAGENGYDDSEELVFKLKPLNPYGESKNEFDKWAVSNKEKPFFWAGLKFFNVYGPNEYHKGRMASVIFHAFNQIKTTGKVKLFKSHNPDYKDGEQLRDFVYVKDVAKIILFLMEHRPGSGIYNVGTGKARTFLDLAKSTFSALNLEPNIEFIDMPEDIRDKYQYFTEARINKILNAGYNGGFHSLEDGIKDYVQNYLVKEF